MEKQLVEAAGWPFRTVEISSFHRSLAPRVHTRSPSLPGLGRFDLPRDREHDPHLHQLDGQRRAPVAEKGQGDAGGRQEAGNRSGHPAGGDGDGAQRIPADRRPQGGINGKVEATPMLKKV